MRDYGTSWMQAVHVTDCLCPLVVPQSCATRDPFPAQNHPPAQKRTSACFGKRKQPTPTSCQKHILAATRQGAIVCHPIRSPCESKRTAHLSSGHNLVTWSKTEPGEKLQDEKQPSQQQMQLIYYRTEEQRQWATLTQEHHRPTPQTQAAIATVFYAGRNTPVLGC